MTTPVVAHANLFYILVFRASLAFITKKKDLAQFHKWNLQHIIEIRNFVVDGK